MKMLEVNAVFKFIDCRGKSPDKCDKGIPLITAKNVKKGFINVEPQEFLNEDQYNSWIERGIPQTGDILFTTEAPLGNVAILPHYSKVVVAQRVICLSPKLPCDTSFYKWYMLADSFQNELTKRATGSTALGIRSKELEKIRLPYPPLPIQQKIAAILDAADAYRQKTKALIEKYDLLAQSLFLEMFGDPVRNEMGWEKVEMKKLCSFQKDSIIPDKIEKGTKYLGLECIEKETGNILQVHDVDNGELKSNKFLFDENYILYGKLRPYLNKVALPNFKGICSTDIIPIKPINGKCNKAFVCYIMRGKGFVSFAHERSSGANLPRISPSEIEKYPIINPPLSLQTLFADRIALIDQQKQQAQQSYEKAEALFNSLLQRAFKGELVS